MHAPSQSCSSGRSRGDSTVQMHSPLLLLGPRLHLPLRPPAAVVPRVAAAWIAALQLLGTCREERERVLLADDQVPSRRRPQAAGAASCCRRRRRAVKSHRPAATLAAGRPAPWMVPAPNCVACMAVRSPLCAAEGVWVPCVRCGSRRGTARLVMGGQMWQCKNVSRPPEVSKILLSCFACRAGLEEGVERSSTGLITILQCTGNR